MVDAILYESECAYCGADTEKTGGVIGYDMADNTGLSVICKDCAEDIEHLMIYIEWEGEE